MIKDIIVGKDQKKLIPVVWTGNESDMDFNIRLTGVGAEATFLMLLAGTDTKSLNIKTNIFHEKENTTSKAIIKGVLDDASKVDFEGLVKIDHGAKNSNAWLAAHLLLVSDQAGGKAVPNLEISENEVKAGHASTVGKVSDEELFYLMSRGLNKQVSTKLIVQGFLESILTEFPIKDAQDARKKLKWI